jgi:DNA gyrase subunit A
MDLTEKNGGAVVATFPVTDNHQIMLVSDKGQLIRTPVENVRITGRSAQGVTVFKVAEGEKVVSVAWLVQEEGEAEAEAASAELGSNLDSDPNI